MQRQTFTLGSEAPQVPSDAEGAASAGDDRRPDRRVVTTSQDGVHKFSCRIQVNGVGGLLPVEGDKGNVVLHLAGYRRTTHAHALPFRRASPGPKGPGLPRRSFRP